MSDSQPIRVDSDVKDRLDTEKSETDSSSLSEVIRSLFDREPSEPSKIDPQATNGPTKDGIDRVDMWLLSVLRKQGLTKDQHISMKLVGVGDTEVRRRIDWLLSEGYIEHGSRRQNKRLWSISAEGVDLLKAEAQGGTDSNINSDRQYWTPDDTVPQVEKNGQWSKIID